MIDYDMDEFFDDYAFIDDDDFDDDFMYEPTEHERLQNNGYGVVPGVTFEGQQVYRNVFTGETCTLNGRHF